MVFYVIACVTQDKDDDKAQAAVLAVLGSGGRN